MGDTLVVALGEDVGDQGGVEVAASDGRGRWQWGEYGSAVRGQVAGAAIEDIVGLDREALHEDVLVVLEGGACGETCRVEDNGLVDGKSFGFGASVPWRTGFAEP